MLVLKNVQRLIFLISLRMPGLSILIILKNGLTCSQWFIFLELFSPDSVASSICSLSIVAITVFIICCYNFPLQISTNVSKAMNACTFARILKDRIHVPATPTSLFIQTIQETVYVSSHRSYTRHYLYILEYLQNTYIYHQNQCMHVLKQIQIKFLSSPRSAESNKLNNDFHKTVKHCKTPLFITFWISWR